MSSCLILALTARDRLHRVALFPENPLNHAVSGRAADGIRTHDLLHGKEQCESGSNPHVEPSCGGFVALRFWETFVPGRTAYLPKYYLV